MKNKPKKPTKPFGYISFSKDGKVKKVINKLSNYKSKQECEAFCYFMELYNECYPSKKITFWKQLQEQGQDFLIKINEKEIEVQLTELFDKEYLIEIGEEEYNSGKWTSYESKTDSLIPYAVDIDKKDKALKKVLEKKFKKNYQSDFPIWLVVYCTNSGYLTEYYENGEKNESNALTIAKEFCKKNNKHFDEIWFSNLQSRPIKI